MIPNPIFSQNGTGPLIFRPSNLVFWYLHVFFSLFFRHLVFLSIERKLSKILLLHIQMDFFLLVFAEPWILKRSTAQLSQPLAIPFSNDFFARRFGPPAMIPPLSLSLSSKHKLFSLVTPAAKWCRQPRFSLSPSLVRPPRNYDPPPFSLPFFILPGWKYGSRIFSTFQKAFLPPSPPNSRRQGPHIIFLGHKWQLAWRAAFFSRPLIDRGSFNAHF